MHHSFVNTLNFSYPQESVAQGVWPVCCAEMKGRNVAYAFAASNVAEEWDIGGEDSYVQCQGTQASRAYTSLWYVLNYAVIASAA